MAKCVWKSWSTKVQIRSEKFAHVTITIVDFGLLYWTNNCLNCFQRWSQDGPIISIVLLSRTALRTTCQLANYKNKRSTIIPKLRLSWTGYTLCENCTKTLGGSWLITVNSVNCGSHCQIQAEILTHRLDAAGEAAKKKKKWCCKAELIIWRQVWE